MRTGITVDLSPADRKRLLAIVDDRNSPQKHVWRGRIVLSTADGLGTAAIMRTAGVSKTAVWPLAGALYGRGRRGPVARQDPSGAGPQTGRRGLRAVLSSVDGPLSARVKLD
jgi:hypothetical protein